MTWDCLLFTIVIIKEEIFAIYDFSFISILIIVSILFSYLSKRTVFSPSEMMPRQEGAHCSTVLPLDEVKEIKVCSESGTAGLLTAFLCLCYARYNTAEVIALKDQGAV